MKAMTTNKNDLENRLIDFAVASIKIAESFPNTKTGNYYAGQIIRSSSSPALNYGEAQDAESKQDFIHKVKVILKELRETNVSFKIVDKLKLYNNQKELDKVRDENNQLISIFVASVKTAKGKLLKRDK